MWKEVVVMKTSKGCYKNNNIRFFFTPGLRMTVTIFHNFQLTKQLCFYLFCSTPITINNKGYESILGFVDMVPSFVAQKGKQTLQSIKQFDSVSSESKVLTVPSISE